MRVQTFKGNLSSQRRDGTNYEGGVKEERKDFSSGGRRGFLRSLRLRTGAFVNVCSTMLTRTKSSDMKAPLLSLTPKSSTVTCAG